MKAIRLVLAGLVLAGGLVASSQVASAAPGVHGKADRVLPVRGNMPVEMIQGITWE